MLILHRLLSNEQSKEDSSLLRAYLATQMSWNIPLFIVLSLLAISYLFFVKTDQTSIFEPFQKILFISGTTLLYLMIGSPLLSLSYLSFSLHMVQMSIVFFIVPPLILLGIHNIPFAKYKLLLRLKTVFRPKLALIMFATLFLLYHLPFMLSFISQHDFIQKLYLSTLFILAFIMWSPIALKRNEFSYNKKRQYSKLSSLLIMPACLIFIVSALLQGMDNPFMSNLAAHLCLPSESLQILPPPFNTKYDQMISGVLMISIHQLGIVTTKKFNDRL